MLMTHNAKDGVRPAAVLVHVCVAPVPPRVTLLHESQNLARLRAHLLRHILHVHAALHGEWRKKHQDFN